MYICIYIYITLVGIYHVCGDLLVQTSYFSIYYSDGKLQLHYQAFSGLYIKQMNESDCIYIYTI